MLNKELEQSLNKAFHDANEKRHEFITVEHLLLMLTDNDAATAVLEACGGDVQLLKTELEIFVDQNTPLLMPDEDRDTQPTLGFQRVLQHALFHRHLRCNNQSAQKDHHLAFRQVFAAPHLVA